MEKLLQEAADDKLGPIRRLYVLAHAARCRRCGSFLERMRMTLAALAQEKQAAPADALARLRAKHMPIGDGEEKSG